MTVRRGQRWELGTVILAFVLLPGIASAQKSILPKECVDCHGSETKYPVRGARSQYLTSGHKNLGNASYANSDDCQGCHTNEGFIERVKKGSVDTKKFVRDPSEIGCFTCHAPHETGNFSLRKTTAVKLANGVTFDRGKGNLCASAIKRAGLPKTKSKRAIFPRRVGVLTTARKRIC